MLPDNKTLAKKIEKDVAYSKAKLAKQYSNTRKCQSFYAGDMLSYQDSVDYIDQNGQRRKTLVKFNKVKPYVNSVKGFMAQNRRRQKYEARLENDQTQELFSTYANSIADYLRSNAYAPQIETQQDGDLLINGYGAIDTALSYGDGYASTEVDGEVLYGRLDPRSVGWDPHARAPNLKDARYVWYCKEYPLEEALRLFEDSEADDFEEVKDDPQSEAYHYNPRGGSYDKIAELAAVGMDWADKEDKIVKVYFYQWFEIEKYYKVSNPLYAIEDQATLQIADIWMQAVAQQYEDFDPRAEVLSFTKDLLDELQEYFGEMMDEPFSFNRKVFYSAVASGKKVFTKYKSVSQQNFTIQFKTGDYDAANNIWVGMVNSMMEPSLYFNKALTELMFTIASNSKGGVMYEEGAINDIAEFETNYAKTDGNVEVADGAISGNKIKDKTTPHMPTGLDNIISIADDSIRDVNGFDPTFMGSREFANDTALFQRQRIKQVMSTLACYFDAATLYQQTNARILLDMMRVYVENNQDMPLRVLGPDGNRIFLRLSTSQLSAEYDVLLDEAPLTQQDKQEQAQVLQAMGDKLLAVGDAAGAKSLYSASVELMPFNATVKERVKDVLNPEGQPVDPAYVQQLEEMVSQLRSASQQAQMNNLVAKTENELAKADKTRAEVRRTQAETQETRASTTEKLQNAKQTDLENQLMPLARDINLTI